MATNSKISFGDHVRVKATPETSEKGLAGFSGQVYGVTTPSVTKVEVIGESKTDYAFNVFFKDNNDSFWFSPELLEFVDHAPGTEITLNGVPKKWVRTETGEWRKESLSNDSTRKR